MILPWDQTNMMTMMTRKRNQKIYREFSFLFKNEDSDDDTRKERERKGTRYKMQLITTETTEEVKCVQNQNNS